MPKTAPKARWYFRGQPALSKLLWGLILAPTLAFGQWQAQPERNGVKLWTEQGRDGLVRVRAQCQVVTRLSAFAAVMNDLEAVPQWMAHVEAVKRLDKPSTTEDVIHTRFHLPWPARNRDAVTLSAWRQDPDFTLYLDIKDAAERYPQLKGYVRMHGVSGQWRLAPLGQGLTEIRYTGSADPAGWLPDWLVNKLSVSSTVKTLAGLCNRITELKYQDSQYPFIKEPPATRTRSER